MKNYVLVLLPGEKETDAIESERMRLTESKTVDSMPPHLTLIGRFAIKDGTSESQIQDIVEGLNIPKCKGRAKNISNIGSAIVVPIESESIVDCYNYILNSLEKFIIHTHPDREGKNFDPHITVIRSESGAIIKPANLPTEFVFDKLCFYEIDPLTAKEWSRQVFCKELN